MLDRLCLDGDAPLRCEVERVRAGMIDVGSVHPEHDEGEEAEQGRRGSGDGEVGPLALRLDAEVGARLFEEPAPAKAGVTSTSHRLTNQASMASAVTSGSVARKAWGLSSPVGSRTIIHRIGRGGRPPWYQIAVPVAVSMARSRFPYQSGTLWGCHTVAASASTAVSLGRRLPLRGGRPRVPLRRGGAGANRLASRRRRVTTQAWGLSAARNAMAAKALSATTTMRRPGNQRRICRTIWRAASSSDFGARGLSA